MVLQRRKENKLLKSRFYATVWHCSYLRWYWRLKLCFLLLAWSWPVHNPVCKVSVQGNVYLPTLTPAGWKLRSHAGSRLRANFSRLIEKCELLPSCLTQFPKYVNSDPCKEQKPCVKWINDNTFLAISDFWSEKHWERAHVYTRPKTGTR